MNQIICNLNDGTELNGIILDTRWNQSTNTKEFLVYFTGYPDTAEQWCNENNIKNINSNEQKIDIDTQMATTNNANNKDSKTLVDGIPSIIMNICKSNNIPKCNINEIPILWELDDINTYINPKWFKYDLNNKNIMKTINDKSTNLQQFIIDQIQQYGTESITKIPNIPTISTKTVHNVLNEIIKYQLSQFRTENQTIHVIEMIENIFNLLVLPTLLFSAEIKIANDIFTRDDTLSFLFCKIISVRKSTQKEWNGNEINKLNITFDELCNIADKSEIILHFIKNYESYIISLNENNKNNNTNDNNTDNTQNYNNITLPSYVYPIEYLNRLLFLMPDIIVHLNLNNKDKKMLKYVSNCLIQYLFNNLQLFVCEPHSEIRKIHLTKFVTRMTSHTEQLIVIRDDIRDVIEQNNEQNEMNNNRIPIITTNVSEAHIVIETECNKINTNDNVSKRDYFESPPKKKQRLMISKR